jgi:HAD superfamily hydrolase (TIGR01450 family)
VPLSPLLARYDSVILDLDGCVYVGDRATPRAPEAIAALRAAGKRLAFVTNDGRRAPEEYIRKLWSLGCTAGIEEIVSVGVALQDHLTHQPPGSGAFVIGSEAVFRHVAAAGHRILNGTPRAESADIVVLVGHDRLDYDEMRTATRAVLAGASIVAGGRDPTFPTSDGPAPGTGAFVAALEYATGCTALSVGKPEPGMFSAALERLGQGRCLVVGDRLDSDIEGAAAAGLDGAIVLTGVTTREVAEAAAEPAPIAVAADLATLVLSDQ